MERALWKVKYYTNVNYMLILGRVVGMGKVSEKKKSEDLERLIQFRKKERKGEGLWFGPRTQSPEAKSIKSFDTAKRVVRLNRMI